MGISPNATKPIRGPFRAAALVLGRLLTGRPLRGPLLGRARAAMPGPWRGHVSAALTLAVVVVLGLVGVESFRTYQTGFASWDWLFISGLATFLVGFRWALSIPERLRGTLVRLWDRGVLEGGAGEHAVIERVDATARAWAGRCALLVSLVLVVATAAAFGWESLADAAPLILIELVAGAVAGRYLGRMAAYGFLAWITRRDGITWRVKPGHVDGCAGWKPLGDFFFGQAMVTAIPAMFLAAWVLLIPIWPTPRYDRWREPYLGLLLVALVFELLAFLLPMWSFHRVMARQKRELLRVADALTLRISQLRAKLSDSDEKLPREALKDQLAYLTQQYWDIENLPTWPMDPATRRSFTLNNLVLALPLLSEITGLANQWSGIGSALAGLLNGPGAHG